MKKTSVITAIIFATVLTFSPLVFATSSGSTNATFYYQPFSEYQFVGPAGVNPMGIPFCHSGIVCYSPSFIRSAYNFPTGLDGSGQTIVIVDAYGSPTIAADLATFDSVFGLPAPPSFQIICPQGGCPSSSFFNTHHGVLDWTFETTLDVEWAHAMAPGANIVLAVAASSSGNAINVIESTVIPMFPGAIMSQSFGIPEYLVHGNNAQIMQAENNYALAQSQGWTVFASAGDSGATNGIATPNANFPASDPLVTAVGGTMGDPYVQGPLVGPSQSCYTSSCSAGLAQYDNSTGLCKGNGPSLVFTCPPAGYGGEQVWNEPAFAQPGNLATGGGAPSLLFGVPSYQSGLGLTSRTTPDVSYNAAINGGVLAFWSACSTCYGYPAGTELGFVFGGTSAGSPQWAAIVALADQAAGHSLGFLNPALYAIGNGPNYANDFHDITAGNNKAFSTPFGYNAAPGYDDATGWGTPNVANLVADLSA